MDDIDMSTIRKVFWIVEEMLEKVYRDRKGEAKNTEAAPPPPRRKKAGGKKTRRTCRYHAADMPPGFEARSLSIIRQSDGSAVVMIDRGSKFTLPKGLAELLLILSADFGDSDDALVGWKSLSEIGRRLSAKEGGEVRRKTTIQRIYRLREELDKRAQGAGRFILTDVEAGARFALWHEVDASAN
jgi:hypothetical protein